MANDCLPGTVALLDSTGDAGAYPVPITVSLSSADLFGTNNYVYFALFSSCISAANQKNLTIPAGATSVPFWYIGVTTSTTETLIAEDLNNHVGPAYRDVRFTQRPADHIDFGFDPYEGSPGQCLSGTLFATDSNGSSAPSPRDEVVQLGSADGGVLYASACDGGSSDTLTLNIPAGSSGASFYVSSPDFGLHTLTASSTDLGGATGILQVCVEPNGACGAGQPCCSYMQCIPGPDVCCVGSGHGSIGTCASCCSGACDSIGNCL